MRRIARPVPLVVLAAFAPLPPEPALSTARSGQSKARNSL